MSNTPGIIATQEGGTLVLTISNPDKRNALKVEMRQDITARIIQAGMDDDVRAIVIRGDGAHFCSGADVSSNVGGAVAANDDGADVVVHPCLDDPRGDVLPHLDLE
ncbi:MAG: hypothetical protein EOP61_27240, partial [Sphingomonadales bacterium]